MTLAQKLYETLCAGVHMSPVPWCNLAPGQQAIYERMEDAATLHLAGSDAATANARVEELLDVIARLVACRKGIEYSTTEEQRAWREAKAVLVEGGR